MKKSIVKRWLAVLFVLIAVLTGLELLDVSLPILRAGEQGTVVSSSKPFAEKKKKKKSKKQNAETTQAPKQDPSGDDKASEEEITEDGEYTSKEDVAAYIHQYGHLPSNYITKKEAQKLGWDSYAGNLDEVAPGKSIGGDRFGNYEGKLPSGKEYHECDIDFTGGYRGSKRIIYSDDGDVYYTEDHYNTFEKLY